MNLFRFGGIIPFIGFRRVVLPCEVAAEMGIRKSRLVEGSMDAIWADSFEIEWFGCGFVAAMKGVQ
jgi:hypothetical protein